MTVKDRGKPPKSGQFKRGKSGNPTAAPTEASSFRPTWPPSLVARMILYVDWERSVEQAFRGARITALTSGGTIPDTADYHVVLEPENQVIGSVNEDSTPDFRTYRCGAPLGQPADARRSPVHRRQHHQAAGVRAFRAGSALRRRYAIASGHPMLHNARARQPPRGCSQ